MRLTQTQLKKIILKEVHAVLSEQSENKYENITQKISHAYELINDAHDELEKMKGPKKDIAKLWKLVQTIDSLGLEIETQSDLSTSDEPEDYGYDEIEVDDFANYSNPRRIR